VLRKEGQSRAVSSYSTHQRPSPSHHWKTTGRHHSVNEKEVERIKED